MSRKLTPAPGTKINNPALYHAIVGQRWEGDRGVYNSRQEAEEREKNLLSMSGYVVQTHVYMLDNCLWTVRSRSLRYVTPLAPTGVNP